VSRKVPVSLNHPSSNANSLGSLSLSASYSNPFPLKSSLIARGNNTSDNKSSDNKSSVLLQLRQSSNDNSNGITKNITSKPGFFSNNSQKET